MAENLIKMKQDSSKKVSESKIPSWEEFKEYAFTKIKAKDDHPQFYTEWLKDKYDSWVEAGWKKSKTLGKKEVYVDIIIWKTTLIQCLPYRQTNKVQKDQASVKPLSETGHMKKIDDDRIVQAWDYYNRTKNLRIEDAECFDVLYARKIFKNGKDISPKTGKPWQEWYNTLTPRALTFAVAYAIDQKMDPKTRNEIRNGRHKLVEVFIKLEALKMFLKRFQTAFALRKSLGG